MSGEGQIVEATDQETNVTHLVWAGRWIEVTASKEYGEDGWRFKNGKDAAYWLLYNEVRPRAEGEQ